MRRGVRRERGSICLYVAVILLSMALLFGAIVPLATNLRGRTTRRIDETKARLAFEAGLALVESKGIDMTLALDAPLPISLDGVTGTVTPTANDAQLAKSLLVTGTMVRNGRSYRFSRVVGARQPHPFAFALFCNGNLGIGRVVSGSNGVGGDLFSNGNVSLNANSNVINGNAMAVGSVTTNANATITGRKLPGQATVAWPTVDPTAYFNAATSLSQLGAGSVNLLNGSLNGVTFANPALTSDYPIWYYGGDLTLKGTIRGKGVIFVKGNLNVPEDLRYATASDRIAIVVKGNVNVGPLATTVDGFLFCGGALSNSKATTVSRGAWAVGSFSSDKDFTIVRDDAILLDTDEATRLRLPYYWP